MKFNCRAERCAVITVLTKVDVLIGILTKKTAMEDSIALGMTAISIPMNVKDVYLTNKTPVYEQNTCSYTLLLPIERKSHYESRLYD